MFLHASHNSHPPVKARAAPVGLVFSLFDDYDKNVLEALQIDFYLWVAVASSILNLGLEPVGDLCSLDLPAIGDSHKYPAAGGVGKSYQLFVQVGQRLLELDLLAFAFFENLQQLLLVHSASPLGSSCIFWIFLHIIWTCSARILSLRRGCSDFRFRRNFNLLYLAHPNRHAARCPCRPPARLAFSCAANAGGAARPRGHAPVRPHVGPGAIGPGLCSTNQGGNLKMDRRLFSVFQLILDAPELLQRRLQAFHNFPRQDRRIGQVV